MEGTAYQTNDKDIFIHIIDVPAHPVTGERILPYRAYWDSPGNVPQGKAARRVGGINGSWVIDDDHGKAILYLTEDGAQYEIGKTVDAGTYDGFGAIPAWLTTQKPEPPPPTPDELIKAEIAAIEAAITARRMREAVLGLDGGWLAAREAEIAALREQLSPAPAPAEAP